MEINGKEYSMQEIEKAVKLYDALHSGELVRQIKEELKCKTQ